MRPQRQDPLAYRTARPAADAPRLVRPARPTRTRRATSPRRRNRHRVSPVVRFNRGLRQVRNLLFLTLFVEIVWLCLTSPLLVVRKVVVSGAHIRTPAQISRAAGLTRPVNIFRARTGHATKALSALPEVQSVRIERRLPRTLAVIVHERQPLASIHVGNVFWVFDASGLVFRKLSLPVPGKPVLVGTATGPVSLGKPLPLAGLRSALSCLARLPELPLARNASFHVAGNAVSWIEEPNGLKVRLGPLDDAPERLALAIRLLNGPDGRNLMQQASVLDVTIPQNEVFKKREAGNGGAAAVPFSATPR